MKEQIFKTFAPDMNEIIVRKGVMWRVSYLNPGKARYSAEIIGWTTKEKEHDVEGEAVIKIVLAHDIENPMTREEFEDYRRRTWPLPHEEGRNPNNTTLGVHSGIGTTKGGL